MGFLIYKMGNPSISVLKSIFKNKILFVSRLGIQMFKPLVLESIVLGFMKPINSKFKANWIFYIIKSLKLHLNSFFLEVWMVAMLRRGVIGSCLPCLWDPKYA
jgi:hypothetical protein